MTSQSAVPGRLARSLAPDPKTETGPPGGLKLAVAAALALGAALLGAGMLLVNHWPNHAVLNDARASLAAIQKDHASLHYEVSRLSVGDFSGLDRVETRLGALAAQSSNMQGLYARSGKAPPALALEISKLASAYWGGHAHVETMAPPVAQISAGIAFLAGAQEAIGITRQGVRDAPLGAALDAQIRDTLLLPTGADPLAFARAQSRRTALHQALERGDFPASETMRMVLLTSEAVLDDWEAYAGLVARLQALCAPSTLAGLEQRMAAWEEEIAREHLTLLVVAAAIGLFLAGLATFHLICLARLNNRLIRARTVLEQSVVERTARLTQANQSLQREVAERREAERRLTRMAMTDSLTGLGNRQLIRHRLIEHMRDTAAGGRLIGLYLIDLDHFKAVNDGLGHQAGDHLLRQLGQRLACLFDENDTIVRLGDDEFAVLVSEMEDLDRIADAARRIQLAIGEPLHGAPGQVELKASIGVSIAPTHSRQPDALLRMAGVALEAAKRAGRGNFQIYRTEMDTQSRDRRELERELGHAVGDGQFELYYQPQMNIRTGEICGAEALIRWHHPTRGLVAPGDFIPMAEEKGSIIEIGRWALWTAGEQRQAWATSGLEGFKVAVNVSPLQIQSAGFVEAVATMLEATGLDPRLLELEVTENLVISQSDDVPDVLHDLYCLGVELAIDDFGTGYSSLNYLKRFSVHRLKIDRSFITGALDEAEDRAIVRTVIRLGHSLGLKVLAEGVEDHETIELLAREGCDEAQGYHIARPMPARDFFEWYTRYNASRGARPGLSGPGEVRPGAHGHGGFMDKRGRSVA